MLDGLKIIAVPVVGIVVADATIELLELYFNSFISTLLVLAIFIVVISYGIGKVLKENS